MLEARDLCCQRGDRRLFEGLTLQLAPGRLLLVEGPNGAGKTSLLRLLAGLALPRSGEVLWRGHALHGQREAFASALCYLGHGAALKDDLTPVENLCADAALSGHPVSSDQVRAVLRHWGLSRAVGLPVRVLSAGQRRRVALARLRLAPAPLWILDEPVNALDTHAVQQLAQQLSQHLLDDGMVVLTSHQDLPLDLARVDRLRLGA